MRRATASSSSDEGGPASVQSRRDAARNRISEEDARAKVRKVLRKARMNPEFPLGRRSTGAILKATKLRRDLAAEQRREYLEALLAGLSDIERAESRDGEIWYALRERGDEVRLDESDPATRELRGARGAGDRAVPRPLQPVRQRIGGR